MKSFVESTTAPASATTVPPTDAEIAAAKILRVIDSCGMRRHGSSPDTRAMCVDHLATGQATIDKIARGEFEFGGKTGDEIGVSEADMRQHGFLAGQGNDMAFNLNNLIEAWEGFKGKTDEVSLFGRR